MSDIRPIRTETDYDWALSEVEAYFENLPAHGTPEADRFDILSDLIEGYEAKHWHIEPADPVEAISFTMEVKGHSQSELAALLGSRSRASEILGRKRPLTLAMAYKLHQQWHIPADALIRPYHIEAGGKERSEKPRKKRLSKAQRPARGVRQVKAG